MVGKAALGEVVCPNTLATIAAANVGAAHVAHDILGANRYYPYLSRFGFGQPTNIDGPEESGEYLSPNDQNWTISGVGANARQLDAKATVAATQVPPLDLSQREGPGPQGFSSSGDHFAPLPAPIARVLPVSYWLSLEESSRSSAQRFASPREQP